MSAEDGFFQLVYEKYEKTPDIFKKSGKFFIEITYLNGDACFVAGFNNSRGKFYSFYGKVGDPTHWYNGLFASMNFEKIKEKSTYALLLDIDSKIFSVIHGTEKYEYNFSSEVVGNEIYGIIVRGGCSNDKTDLVWLNYGHNKFVNEIPSKYKPWIPLCQKKTCKIVHRYFNSMIVFVHLLVIS